MQHNKYKIKWRKNIMCRMVVDNCGNANKSNKQEQTRYAKHDNRVRSINIHKHSKCRLSKVILTPPRYRKVRHNTDPKTVLMSIQNIVTMPRDYAKCHIKWHKNKNVPCSE